MIPSATVSRPRRLALSGVWPCLLFTAWPAASFAEQAAGDAPAVEASAGAAAAPTPAGADPADEAPPADEPAAIEQAAPASPKAEEQPPEQAVEEAPHAVEVALPRPPPDRLRGEDLYRVRCAQCHGPEGGGDGAVARFLDPRPRDLRTEPFKLRSTQPGEPPTDEDLFRTVSRGIRGTGMPGFAGLSLEDRWQLVFYLKSISKRLAEPAKTGKPPALPPAVAWSPTRVRQGHAVYQRVQCALCHGPDGRGDGPISEALKDQAGEPIHPFDLTRGWKLKRGDRAADIVSTLLTGLDGTPMPSFRSTLTDEEAWVLAYYIRSLFLDRPPAVE